MLEEDPRPHGKMEVDSIIVHGRESAPSRRGVPKPETVPCATCRAKEPEGQLSGAVQWAACVLVSVGSYNKMPWTGRTLLKKHCVSDKIHVTIVLSHPKESRNRSRDLSHLERINWN